MKKINFSILLWIALPVFLLAQTPLSVSEGSVRYEGTEYPCLEVILQPEAKEVKKAWEDFLKKEYDVNLRGIGFLANKDVLTAEEVDFPELSDKKLDFYTEVIEQKGQTRMSVFASLGYDIHIAPRGDYAQGFREMERIVNEFLEQYLPEYYENTIDDLSKEVSGLEEEQQELQQTLADNRDRIKDLEDELKKLEKDNKDLEKDIEDKIKALEEARLKLEARQQDFEVVKQKLKIKASS